MLGSKGIEDSAVEKAFITSLLHKGSFMGKVGMAVPPEALIEPSTQAMFVSFLSLYGLGVEFEEIAIRNELVKIGMYEEAGGAEGVESYFLRPTQADPMVLGKIILDLHCRRLELDLADLISAKAYNRSGDDNDMAARLDYYQKALQEIQKLSFSDERALSSDEFGGYYEGLMNNRQSHVGVPKMVFAWPELNRLSPSFADGDLVILLAESGAGKTSLMETQAEYLWKQGYHGVFYHLELGMDKMADRRMARGTGIALKLLQDGREEADGAYTYLSQDERDIVRQVIADQATWPGSLTLKHCPGWTMSQVTADARQRAEAGPLDFVMVDYFNKVRVVRRSGSYASYDIGLDIELFKTTLEDLYIVGWMAAQFHKGAKGRKGYRTVADARDTGELDDKSNIGMVLDRPVDESTGRRVDMADLYITKCNSGREGKATLLFDGPRFLFRDAEVAPVDLDLDFDEVNYD